MNEHVRKKKSGIFFFCLSSINFSTEMSPKLNKHIKYKKHNLLILGCRGKRCAEAERREPSKVDSTPPVHFWKYTDVCQPNYMVGVSYVLYGGGPRGDSAIQNTWEKSPLPPPPAAPARPRQRICGGMHARGKCTELPTEWRGQAWRLTP